MAAAISDDVLVKSKYIYNHDIMNCTAEGVVGNHLYSGRALGITEPWDIIQLHEQLKPLWPAITAHYNRIGLKHSKNVVWSLELDQLGAHIGYQPSVFYYGPDEDRYWGNHQWLNTVNYINSKNNFMALAEELGVDVPKTLCFSSVSDIDEHSLEQVVYPCYLKAAVSVSGVGIYCCKTKDELLQKLHNFSSDVPVQIQEEVTTDIFLNMQYMVENNRLIRLAASEQILDGFVHQGNRFPASHAPWDEIEPLAEWLMAHGINGIFAFDVAVVETESGVRYPAIECNPRFNGASYPTLIANKLRIPEWSAVSLNSQHRHLKDIDLSAIEYNKQTGEGVIIVNWGTMLEGKLVVLIAGSEAYQQATAVELAKRL